MTIPANGPEHETDGAHVQPQQGDAPAYAPEGSGYHPDAPAGAEGEAYTEGGAEYDALERQRQARESGDLPLTEDDSDR
jgi:hypothetical protein